MGASVVLLDDPGVPDLLVGFVHRVTFEFVTLLVEVKGPTGTLTSAQKDFFKTFMGEKYVIQTPSDMATLLFKRMGYLDVFKSRIYRSSISSRGHRISGEGIGCGYASRGN